MTVVTSLSSFKMIDLFLLFCMIAALLLGQMVSPQAQPTTTEGRTDGSRENSAVDFSKVRITFQTGINLIRELKYTTI